MTGLKGVQEFFFEGMARGWAAGNNGSPIPDFPGWSEVVYEDPRRFAGYVLVDRWGRDPDTGKSSGSTTITRFGVPLWVTWYGGGSYEKLALPLLKQALMENYHIGIFNGGRGPREYPQQNLRYVNQAKGDFVRFSGTEYIQDIDEDVGLGFHEYWGGSLLYLKKTSESVGI